MSNWRSDEDLKKALNDIAQENKWTLSTTMNVLLKEAVKAREVTQKQGEGE